MIEKEIFENRKTALLMEIKALEEKRAALQDKTASVSDRLAEFLELAGSVSLQYEMALAEEKRDLLRIVTSNRYIDGKNVVTELHLPLQEVASTSSSDGCMIHDL